MKIIQEGNPVLRNKSIAVPVDKINTPEIRKVISTMRKALEAEDDGVAIAAPQIGENLRIFVVSGRAEKILKGEEETDKVYEDKIFINPVITKKSKEKTWLEEGCLSVRYLYGKVRRHDKVQIEALDENGKKISRGASGLMSQIFQHETDHLDGLLFIDQAKDVHEMNPIKESDE